MESHMAPVSRKEDLMSSGAPSPNLGQEPGDQDGPESNSAATGAALFFIFV